MSFGQKLHAALAKDSATSSTLKILFMPAIQTGKNCAKKPLWLRMKLTTLISSEWSLFMGIIIWCTDSDATVAQNKIYCSQYFNQSNFGEW